ncbi:MAG: type II toxin-antitoxin system RelE/ParE family toxin [Deltaproteobacteria bacterium]|nr:type II toxin-antitoxin system RelE/ParE family toxin [Deltaproteobacteria bacterium]
MKLEIRFFQTARGDEPVKDYIKELSAKDRAKIGGCLRVLEVTGRLDMPHGRKMAGQKDLFEIRAGRHRVFYGFFEGEVVLLRR